MMPTMLDTNVIIDILENRSHSRKLVRAIRGKQVRLVVCETVLRELRRVREWSEDVVLTGLEELFGRKRIVVSDPPKDLKTHAKELERRYEMAHNGDVHILAQCRMDGCALITRDGNMRQVASMIGVLVFHPKHADRL